MTIIDLPLSLDDNHDRRESMIPAKRQAPITLTTPMKILLLNNIEITTHPHTKYRILSPP